MSSHIGIPVLWAFLALLGVHWFADFVLQTHWQASNKSKRVDALLRHVATYTAVLVAASLALFGVNGLVFAGINGLLHFGTDFLTSRWSAPLYAKQDWHCFFVIIGFDQLIHQSTLAVTMWFLISH
jgi:hypothetical protein